MEGSTISKEQSKLIRKYTNVYEWEDVAENYDVSFSSLKNAIYGYCRISYRTKPGIEDVKKIALKNLEKLLLEADKDRKTISSI